MFWRDQDPCYPRVPRTASITPQRARRFQRPICEPIGAWDNRLNPRLESSFPLDIFFQRPVFTCDAGRRARSVPSCLRRSSCRKSRQDEQQRQDVPPRSSPLRPKSPPRPQAPPTYRGAPCRIGKGPGHRRRSRRCRLGKVPSAIRGPSRDSNPARRPR
jgi:hypothetical protein